MCYFGHVLSMIWNGSDDNLQAFHDELNSYHPSIELTIEVGGNTINYLGLKISLKEVGPNVTPQFDIFRKPTFSGVSIHRPSYYSRPHKLASTMSSIHRLVSNPLSSSSFNNEINQIEKIAGINGSDIEVHQLVKKKIKNSSLNLIHFPFPCTYKKWLRLPYLGRPSEVLARDLHRFGYSSAFYPVTTLKSLSSLKDKTPLERERVDS
mgnify:CR=1 FL=1